MKYRKCPRCELNYVTGDEQLCKVCLKELQFGNEEEEIDLELCPFCYKNYVDADQLMCDKCAAKRKQN